MTRLIARLVLAMLTLPLTGAVFVLCMAVLATRGTAPAALELVSMWVVVYAFVAVYWVLLWRSMVRWTPERKFNSVAAGLGAMLIGVAVAVILRRIARIPIIPACFVGGGLPPIAWVLGTVLIWRETPSERLHRISEAGTDAVSCPVCGYNLTGLREALCPECGSRFTLDQLLAAQPHSDAATLPRESVVGKP